MGAEPANDLHVYGAKDTLSLAGFSLKHSYPELNFPFKIIYHEISNERAEVFNCGGLVVNTEQAKHAVPCISCAVKCGNKLAVYTSDTLPNSNLASYKDADLLIHEGMMINAMAQLSDKVKHSLSSQAGRFATQIKAKHLALVHIPVPGIRKRESIVRRGKSRIQWDYFNPF